MPERSEVAVISDQLNNELKDKILESVCVDEKSKYYNKLDTPTGTPKINLVYSKGKRLIFSLDNSEYITMSLGLEGNFSISQEELFNRNKHTNMWFKIKNGNTYFYIYYSDSRHFGNYKVCRNDAELKKSLKDIGPDLLTDEVTLEQYTEKIKKRRIQNIEICKFLMNQKYFSGIGNYLKSDILYLCGIHPSTILKDLTDQNISDLLENSIMLIKKTYAENGATIKSYRDLYGNPGNYKTLIYGRKTTDKKEKVIKEVFSDKRASYYVSNL